MIEPLLVSRRLLLAMAEAALGKSMRVEDLLDSGMIADLAEVLIVQERLLMSDHRLFWEILRQRSADPRVGLHAAQRFSGGGLGVVEFLLRYSGSCQEAFDRCIPYLGLLSEGLCARLETHGSQSRFSFVAGQQPHPQACEFAFAVTFRLICAVLPTIELDEVRFAHPPPAEGSREHTDHFGCPVHFGCEANAVLFPTRFLYVKFGGADPRLCTFLQEQGERAIRQLPSMRELADELGSAYLQALSTGQTNIEAVARRVGLGYRTLQRRLKNAGASHRQLLDRARHRLATCYLASTERSIDEIANLLGFSGSSAFNRTFRRWTGLAPTAYRARVARPPAEQDSAS